MPETQKTNKAEILISALKTKNSSIDSICDKLGINFEGINKLTKDESVELWKTVDALLREEHKTCVKISSANSQFTDDCASSVNLMSFIVDLGLKAIFSDGIVPSILIKIAMYFHSLIMPYMNNEKVKDKISFFLENWWIQDLTWKEKMIQNALEYLIHLSSRSLKHVRRLHKIIDAVKSSKPADNPLLLKLVKEKTLISIREGQEIIEYLLKLDRQWTLETHGIVKYTLENSPMHNIHGYADIYAKAWLNGSKETKTTLAECIESIILDSFRCKRDTKGRKKVGRNLLTFLRRLSNYSQNNLRTMVRSQLHKWLWSHLKAPDSAIRCNAADIVFLVYPEGKSKSVLARQHGAITLLLDDPSDDVCIVALNGIFQIMKTHWHNIANAVLSEWLDVSFHYLKTCENPQIRITILRGLKELLSNENALLKLKKTLAQLENVIYDPNNDTILALFDLLAFIRDDVEMELGDVIPISTFLELLEIVDYENSLATRITRLLWSNICKSAKPGDILQELVEMRLENANGTNKFLLNLKDEIDYNLAVNLTEEAFIALDNYVERELSRKHSESNCRRNRRKSTATGAAMNFKRAGFDELSIQQTLLDVAAIILKILYSGKNVETCQRYETNLMMLLANKLPAYHEFFKDTQVSDSVFYLFSLVPKSLLQDYSKFVDLHLKELSRLEISDDRISTLLHIFVKWDEMGGIFSLLSSLVGQPCNQKNKVKCKKSFDIKEKKIEHALNIFHNLLENPEFCGIVEKNHAAIVCFWKSLEFVKELIVYRLKNNDMARDVISEEVLFKSLHRYLSLIPLLHKSDSFDAPENISRNLRWIRDEIISRHSGDEEINDNEFFRKVLKSFFDFSTDLMAEHQVSVSLCSEIVMFCVDSLLLPNGIILVDECLNIMSSFLNYSKVVGKNDNNQVHSVIIRSLLMAVMVTLTKYSTESLKKHTNNLKQLFSVLHKLFAKLDDNAENRTNVHLAYTTIILDSAVASLSQRLNPILDKENSCPVASIDMLNLEFPYLTEKILQFLLTETKYRKLVVEVLELIVPKYADIDSLSIQLILHKISKETCVRNHQENIREIISKMSTRKTSFRKGRTKSKSPHLSLTTKHQTPCLYRTKLHRPVAQEVSILHL